MEPNRSTESLEQQIAAWRAHLRGSSTISRPDAAELEDHLREQIAALRDVGLSTDEAFLVSVKRMGALDALTREFAREHSERLWKQLMLAGDAGESGEPSLSAVPRTIRVALALAVAAAIAMKLPALFGVNLDGGDRFYSLNVAFLTLPFVVAYFAWARPLTRAAQLGLAAAFAIAALIVNLFPFPASAAGASYSATHGLTILHLPIALWLAVGVAYVGGAWRGSERRMDFVRFTGELFIYFVLLGLGGAVLIGLTFALFNAIGVDAEPFVAEWVLPCGAAGALVVATWLVEAKQSVIENMAPVLARIFTPLFALVLLAFVVTMVGTGRAINVEREVLLAIDLLLVVVFGLLLYAISARDAASAPAILDWMQLTLVVSALLVDVLALWAIGARISEFGFSPNRLAALGLNVVLLVNLAGSAVLYARFLRAGAPFQRLWDWQVSYLYVIAAWAAVVAFLFPPLFAFA